MRADVDKKEGEEKLGVEVVLQFKRGWETRDVASRADLDRRTAFVRLPNFFPSFFLQCIFRARSQISFVTYRI